MFPYTYMHNRSGVDAGGRLRRTDSAEQPRLNPWLLWRPEPEPAPHVLTIAETAECCCPDICNRDHANE